MPRHAATDASRNLRSRSGFTMVEIMVVIAIMSLLIVLAITVMGGVLGTAKERATQATIRKIDGALRDRAQAYDRLFEGPNFHYFRVEYAILKRRNNYTQDQMARIHLKKKLAREIAFPQSFADAGITPVGRMNHETESAEILYWLVTGYEMPNIAPTTPANKRSPDSLRSSFTAESFGASEVADTDGNGRFEFVDAWGKPIHFYRWPTRLIRPAVVSSEGDDHRQFARVPRRDIAGLLWNGLPRESPMENDEDGNPYRPRDDIYIDQDDPQGLLSMSHQFLEIPTDPAIPLSKGLMDWEMAWHTPETMLGYLIVSAGPDGDLGLYEPTRTLLFGHLAQPKLVPPPGQPLVESPLFDNITNRNIR